MRLIPLVLAGVMVTTAAFAQPVPPTGSPVPPPTAAAPPPPAAQADATPDAPPPPPPGAPRAHVPPPPPGAAVILERGAGGITRVDVHCAQRETTTDCADIATRLFSQLTGVAGGK